MENPFWTYSLATYAKPGMAAACLRLQDEFGLDVNMVLFCLYAGANGRALTPGDFDALDAVVLPWQQRVVKPLREARRAFKASRASFPEGMPPHAATLELLAEEKQQQMMWAAVPFGPGKATAESAAATLDANLAAYTARASRAGLARVDARGGAALPVLEMVRQLAREARGAQPGF